MPRGAFDKTKELLSAPKRPSPRLRAQIGLEHVRRQAGTRSIQKRFQRIETKPVAVHAFLSIGNRFVRRLFRIKGSKDAYMQPALRLQFLKDTKHAAIRRIKIHFIDRRHAVLRPLVQGGAHIFLRGGDAVPDNGFHRNLVAQKPRWFAIGIRLNPIGIAAAELPHGFFGNANLL